MRRYDLVIVGMGSAGMTAAEFASTLPIKVAAVERGRLGGDCLWTGCVPSKALLASAKVAHHMRTAGAFGIAPVEPEIDTSKVFDRIRHVQARIAATDDSPQRFRDELGVDLIEGTARLTSPTTLDVDGERIETRFVLLATGSRPLVPPIDGLAEAGHLDSESIWEIERAPASLVILGGGPIALEMAQGFRRLGAQADVDAGLRTNVDSVSAAGDVAGRYLFTHAAGFEGVRAVRNMLFPGQSKGEYDVPWCTFTDPELAHAGLTEQEARERFGPGDVEVHRHELTHSDRARADGTEEGLIRVVTHKDRVVGAHILAASAGELIGELALAIDQGLKLADVGAVIHVYPTLATEVGRVGAEAAFDAARRYRFLVRSRA